MGWIFKDEPAEVQKQPEVQKPVTSVPKKYAPTFPEKTKSVFSPTPTTYNGVPDEKFVSMLEQVIMDNNIPGLDYIEFKKAVDKMSNLPIDESTKILTSFSIFESQGCTKDSLLKSIDTYINLINKEQVTFNNELQTSYNEKVAGKKAEIEKAEKQIAELSKKIAELNMFIETTSQETEAEEEKLKTADSSFKQSAQKVISVLQSDKEKIATYIK